MFAFREVWVLIMRVLILEKLCETKVAVQHKEPNYMFLMFLVISSKNIFTCIVTLIDPSIMQQGNTVNAKAHLKYTITSTPAKYKIAALQKKKRKNYEEQKYQK
jgi:hypothetical protein